MRLLEQRTTILTLPASVFDLYCYFEQPIKFISRWIGNSNVDRAQFRSNRDQGRWGVRLQFLLSVLNIRFSKRAVNAAVLSIGCWGNGRLARVRTNDIFEPKSTASRAPGVYQGVCR